MRPRCSTTCWCTEGLENLAIAPINLKSRLLEMISAEADHARAGRPAEIWVKVNSLVETRRSSTRFMPRVQAGVKISLVVRGICALRPGIVGLSENIRVKSVVLFLEHSRIVCFGNGGGLPSKSARFLCRQPIDGRN